MLAVLLAAGFAAAHPASAVPARPGMTWEEYSRGGYDPWPAPKTAPRPVAGDVSPPRWMYVPKGAAKPHIPHLGRPSPGHPLPPTKRPQLPKPHAPPKPPKGR